jgi:hypothetical protein
MAYTTFVLSDPATGLSVVIGPRDGVAKATLDVQPSVRAVSDSVVSGDGTNDITEFADAAAVTLSLLLSTSAAGVTPEDFLDEIAPLLAPYRRPVLVVGNDQWTGTRQLAVRLDSKTAPVDNPVTTAVAISWKVPSGTWQETAGQEYDIPAAFTPTTGLHFKPTTGLHFTITTGMHFPAGNSPGEAIVTVGGSMRPPWTARLYGPCTGPKIANDTTGDQIIFTDGLVLGAGEYVELDSQARTALKLSDPAQSQLGFLDFANSEWLTLEPGANLIRYFPSSGSGAVAQLLFSNAWLP